MSDVTVERARVAGLSQRHDPGDPELVEAQTNLKTMMLRRHIEKVLDAAPPLTQEQRNRLALLLQGG
jgi:hypothetical protein